MSATVLTKAALTADGPELRKAISAACAAVQRSATIDVLKHLLVEVSADRVRLSGSDLDIEASADCSAQASADWSVCLDAASLSEVSRRFSGEVRMERTDAGVLVSFGRSRVTLPTLAASAFQKMRTPENADAFEVKGAALSAMLGTVAYAMDRDTRTYLMGVYIQSDSGVLRGVATNTHRIAVAEIRADCEVHGAIIPAPTVAHIAALCGRATGDVRVEVSENLICVSSPSERLTSKLVEGTYPDWRRAMPASSAGSVTVTGKELKAATELAYVLGKEMTRRVLLECEGGRMRVSLDSRQQQAVATELEADASDQPLRIGLNAKYLEQACCDGPMTIQYGDPHYPILITHEGSDARHVIMPLRISQ